MEATIHVFLYVLEAVWDVQEISVHLQPSVTKHKTFTDYLFIYQSNTIKGFIEVKKIGVATNLNATTNETAQALREAHMLLLEKGLPLVPFDSSEWSFGVAKKNGTGMEIVKVYMGLATSTTDQRHIVALLKAMVTGAWPKGNGRD